MAVERDVDQSVGDLVPSPAVESRIATGDQHAAGLPEVVAAKHQAVDALQNALMAMPSLHVKQHVLHHFAPGVYARQWFSHAGEVTVGKIHRKHTLNILACGKVMVVNAADDKDKVIITAPYVWLSPPGSRRAVLTLEDCSWITIHVTTETDLEKIEAEFIMGEAQ